MRKGILGGTFDPPHVGHLIVAEHVRERLDLGVICFVPVNIPPHKKDQAILDQVHRVAMLRLAIQGNLRFAVSDNEVVRGGISYTVDTLKEFKRDSPEDALFLLVGMDNAREFESWKSPEQISRLATIVAMSRPGFPSVRRQDAPLSMLVCEVPDIAIASSGIRARVKQGQSIRYLVPRDVEEYIVRHGLYR